MGLLALLRRRKDGKPSTEPSLPKQLLRVHYRRVVSYYLQRLAASSSWIFYIVGLVVLLLLPYEKLHHRARTDENALLPGQANKYWSALDVHAVNEYRQQLKKVSSLSGANATVKADFLSEQFKELGLDGSVQDFVVYTHEKKVQGANAYGIFRAPRADGTEAIVISAPWTCGDGKLNADGVSYVLGLANFLPKFSHWAKDFVFLITNPSPIGTHAWLEAYHGQQSGPKDILQYDPLARHSGVIQEAINLEFCGDGQYTGLGVFVEGLNGQLPNADLVTTVVSTAKYESIPVGLHDTITPTYFADNWARYLFNLESILGYMTVQAPGLPMANHALYSRYHIEALTIRGMNGPETYKVGAPQIGRAIESALRSLNNLLERLHHAYWFYLMPSAFAYIPISVYIPPIILLSVTLIFQSLKLWWESGDTPTHPPPRPKILPKSGLVMRPKEIPSFPRRDRPLFLPLATLIMCHATGFLTFYLAPTLRVLTALGHLTSFNVAIGAFIASTVLYSFLIPMLQRLLQGSGAGTSESAPAWMMLKCLASAELAAALIALATLNPSLSVALALPTVPAFVLARPAKSYIRFFLSLAAVSIASPLGLLAAVAVWSGLDTAMSLASAAVDGWLIYRAWLLPFICLVYWPLNMVAHVIIGMEQ